MAIETDPAGRPRLLPSIQSSLRAVLQENFEGVFVIGTLLALGTILVFIEQKLAFLNLFFLPVLAAGVFMNARSAVLGALLAIAWTAFFAVVDPGRFANELDGMGLYLHLLSWASFLLLTGAVVGRMAESLRERYVEARDRLQEVGRLREDLAAANQRLEERNLTLEVTKAKVESVLYATMDPHVAKLIIDRRLRDEKRPVSVLFADLADFTRNSEDRPPESVIEELNALFNEMEPILTRYRGHLDKYLGDGLMAEFGIPVETQAHPLLAVLAGLRIQDRLRERSFPGKVRVGIASGTSVVGLVGSEHRKNYTAVGDIVNLASRLQAMCPVGSLVVDEATHEAVGRWFQTRRIRVGLSPEEQRNLEARLEMLKDAIASAPTSKLCQEAANLCSELGDMDRALRYSREAVELAPEAQRPVERAIASALLTGEERGFVTIKGKRRRVAVYEVLGLRDPLADTPRLPQAAIDAYQRAAAGVWVPRDHVHAVEAIEGALGHGQVSAALAAALAHAMGLGDAEVRTSFLAGWLHDIGKRAVPEYLLPRERQIDDLPKADRDLLRSHVDEAEKAISEWGLPRSGDLLETIRQHQERFDGSGYPAALAGQDIRLEARILHFADAYETLTGWRPYREPLTPRAALAEIERDMRDQRLDPRVGEVFLGLMGEHRNGRS